MGKIKTKTKTKTKQKTIIANNRKKEKSPFHTKKTI